MGSEEYSNLRFLKKCKGKKNQGGMLCRCEPVERRAFKAFLRKYSKQFT
jgi:hypothetical protein